jgi:hypothetical protein
MLQFSRRKYFSTGRNNHRHRTRWQSVLEPLEGRALLASWTSFDSNFTWSTNAFSAIGNDIDYYKSSDPYLVPPVSSGGVFDIQVGEGPELLPTSVSSVAASGTYGGLAKVTATLTSGGAPLAGEAITFTLDEGGSITPIGMATTDASGVATLSGVTLHGFGAGSYSGVIGASFAGSATDRASVATGDLTVTRAQATLALSELTFTDDGTIHLATITADPAGLTGVTVIYVQNGLALPAPTQAGSYSVTATLSNPNYAAATVTGTMVINPAPPFVTGEQSVFRPKTNKKGKPVGKPIFTGLTFDFSGALNLSSALTSANYQVDTVTIKRVKQKNQRILRPITNFSVAYSAGNDSVTLTFTGKQTFPTGGQITVVSGPLEGLMGTSGAALVGDKVFTIARGGRSVT